MTCRYSVLAIMALLASSAAVAAPADSSAPPIPVAVETVTPTSVTRDVEITGIVRARNQSDLAFRTGGQIAERLVDVGDHVEKGQVLARLDPLQQQADVRSAQAALDSAQASLDQASANFDRQKQLLSGGFATRAAYDAAQVAFLSAQSAVAGAQANLSFAKDQLSFTELTSDQAGLITARLAETGQVVSPAQTVYSLASDGARDAVFNVFESLLVGDPKDVRVDIRLVSDPKVSTIGTVREVSPSVDPATGTVLVKLALDAPPDQMTLGSPVIGRGRFAPHDAIKLPWTALTRQAGAPAVWVVDPASGAVASREVRIESYVTGFVLIAGGLKPGETVVTLGTQLLRPGLKVAVVKGATP